MGVTGLWPILQPVKKHKPLSSLQGQTLAVDLSIWVCENQGVRQMQNRVLKPHLRNLFFRISTLLQLGIKLVFVIEGKAPALKHGEMGRRLQARQGGIPSANTKRKFGRGRLQSLLKECCDLLDALGVPYVQSQGEAESTCAALNAAGLVDACVSDDGDCFLYGAKMVYRNLTIDAKDPHVESFSMEEVTSDLSLTRERLIALALLLGCDYCPAGVPGVGETWAIKLMRSLASVDVLQRFRQWKHMTASDCLDSTEACVWRKASVVASFPPQKVIEEYLTPKDPILSAPPVWYRPCILKMLRLGSHYMEWPEEYSLEKILPLATLWEQLNLGSASSTPPGGCLRPNRIVKRRVRQGVPCFEVEWENDIKGVVDEHGQPRALVTLEQEQRFHACYPALVDSFIQLSLQMKEEKSKKGRKAKARKDVDTLSSQLDSLTVSSQSNATEDPALGPSCKSQPRVSIRRQTSTSGADGAASAASSSRNFESTSSCPLPSSAEQDGARTTGVSVSQGTFGADCHVLGTDGTVNQTCGIRSPSVINRSVAYVPLSQRLKVLRENENTCGEKSDIIDLDDSYTYIPLSQRLKARLGSQQRATSSSSTVSSSSLAASTQDTNHPSSDTCLNYVPLSERLKNSFDSTDEVFTNLSPSEGFDTFKASTSLRSSELMPEKETVRGGSTSLRTSESAFEKESVRSVSGIGEPGDSRSATGVAEGEPGDSRSVTGVAEGEPGDSRSVTGVAEGEPGDSRSVTGVAEGEPGDSRSVTGVAEGEPGDNWSVTGVAEGGGDRQLGTGNTPKSALHVSTLSTSETCSPASKTDCSDNNVRESGYPAQGSGPDPAAALQKCSLQANEDMPGSDDGSPNTSSGHSAADCDWRMSCTSEDQTQKKKPSFSAVSKGCGKKQMTGSQQRRGGRPRPQRTKARCVVTDLLENWSDTEASACENQNRAPVITVSVDKPVQDTCIPGQTSNVDQSSTSVHLTTEEVLNSRFSVEGVNLECSPLCYNRQTDTVHPESGIPFCPSVCEAQPPGYARKQLHPESSAPLPISAPHMQHPDSVCRRFPDLSQDGDSFVSDGHFTLHHTLFTSVDESNENKEFFSDSLNQSSDLPSGYAAGTKPARQHPTRAVSPAHTVGQQTSDSSPAARPSWGRMSDLKNGVRQSAEEAGHHGGSSSCLLSSTRSSAVEREPGPCPSAARECPSAEGVLQSADTVPSPQPPLEGAQGSRQPESTEDECFLPLSQRLRLKQSGASRALSTISMF